MIKAASFCELRLFILNPIEVVIADSLVLDCKMRVD